MLSIRLKRIGKKHQAAFRVVIGEARSKLKGDYTEDLGWYNPHLKKGGFNAERIKYWMSVGAKASDTVHNLLVKHGIIEGKKIAVHKKPKGDAAAAPAAKPVEAAAPAVTPAEAK
jgi:small subunit ribosomal protein S16